MPTEVVHASRNAKKLKEMQALLAPLGWELRLVSEFTDEEAAETAPTFVENALLKARHAARVSGLPAIAEKRLRNGPLVTAVLTYVRREWDHAADPVGEELVAKVRNETEGRAALWTAKELQGVK